MPLGDGIEAGIFLGVSGTATAAAAWRAAGRLVGRDALDRSLAATVLALGGLCSVLLVLGIAGLLTRAGVAVAVVVVAAAVLLALPATPGGWDAPRGPRAELLVALAVGALVAGLALALGVQGFTTSNDTLQYHTPNAGTWLHARSLLTLPLATPGYLTNAYPSDHTLTGLWLMLATGSDQLAYVVNAAWGVLAVLGAALFARALGGQAGSGALLAVGVVMTPVVFGTQANSLLSDLAAAGGVVAGAGAALRAAAPGRHARGWAVIAGIALGLAAGSKYTAFVPAAGVAALPLLLRGRAGLRPAATIVIAAVPLVLFWLVRNAVEFGNPLYPQALGPLDGYTSPLGRFDTPISTHLLDGHWEIVRRWLRLARDLVGFAFLLPLGALVAGLVAWRRRERALGAAAALVALAVAGYLVTPFTGGGPGGSPLLIGSQLRYALPALLLAAPLVAVLAGRRGSALAAVPLLVFGAVKIVQNDGPRPELDLDAVAVVTGLAAAALAVAAVIRPELVARARRAPVVATLAAAALIAGGTAAVLHEQDPRGPTVTERLLAACPDATVGVVSAHDVRELMGRDFSIDVVAVDEGAAAGRKPILDPRAVDRRLAALGPDLAVGYPGPTQAAGWNGPPGWRAVARQGPATLYAPRGGCAR